MIREEVEVCPHCDSENILQWDVEKDGYVIKCPQCGKEMMLCDACCHSDDNKERKCDWRVEGNICICFRGSHVKE